MPSWWARRSCAPMIRGRSWRRCLVSSSESVWQQEAMAVMTLNNVFMALTGIYEPSAIQQLPDGRFLVVEDEKKHPLSLVTINPDGGVSSIPLNSGLLKAG